MRTPTKVSVVVVLLALTGCNTIKSLMGGTEEEDVSTSAEALASAAKALEAAEEAGGAAAEAEAGGAAGEAAEVGGEGGEGGADSEEIKPANEALVKRFDDEKKFEDEDKELALTADANQVFDSPENGKLLALLKKDHTVKKLAERGEFTLTTFTNPDKPDETLMGWLKTANIAAEAGDDEPASDGVACGPGLTRFQGTPEFCAVACTANSQCPNGQTCSGAAKKLENGQPGAVSAFCKKVAAAVPVKPPPVKPPPKKDPPKQPEPRKKKKKKKKKKAD